MEAAAAFALSKARSERQAHLLRRLFLAQQAKWRGQPMPLWLALPLETYHAFWGMTAADCEPEQKAANGLMVAVTLFYLGLDLLDEQADSELTDVWDDVRPAEITLLAATLFASLSPLALMELDAPLAIRAAMQTRLAQALLLLSAGQQQDVHFAGQDEVAPEQILASVEAKSGEELALFAAWGALLAQPSNSRLEVNVPPVEALAAFGRALGTAAQIASDIHDLFIASQSRDFASGTRTLPVALYLDRLPAVDRERFSRILERARRETTARAEARTELLGAGALRESAFYVERYCQRARSALRQADLTPNAQRPLLALVASVSPFTPCKTIE